MATEGSGTMATPSDLPFLELALGKWSAEDVQKALEERPLLLLITRVRGEGRHPIDGQPAAYVCRHRTCDAPVTSVKALLERCAA
jgi:uncharacterized protein YyaL (SSP411 family)